MKTDKVAFIVRVEDSFNYACRCINSIKRQTVKDYKIVVFAYNEELAAEIEKAYPKIRVEVVADNGGFKNKVNAYIARAKVKYYVLADSDSVFAVDTVETILSHTEDVVVFNMSKYTNGNFKPFYKESMFSDVGSFLGGNLCLWNIAFSTDLPVEKEFGLQGLLYHKQALFVMLCLAFASSVAFENKFLVYKVETAKKESVPDEFYDKNKKDIKRAIKEFSKKGDAKAKMQIIKKFFLNEIEESFSLPFLKRLKKAIPIIKLMWF